MKNQITMTHQEAEEITNSITAALNTEEDSDGDDDEMLWTSTACYTSDIDNEELPSSNCQEMDYSNEAQLHW